MWIGAWWFRYSSPTKLSRRQSRVATASATAFGHEIPARLRNDGPRVYRRRLKTLRNPPKHHRSSDEGLCVTDNTASSKHITYRLSDPTDRWARRPKSGRVTPVGERGPVGWERALLKSAPWAPAAAGAPCQPRPARRPRAARRCPTRLPAGHR